MMINKLQTKNFQGLEGTQQKDLGKKVLLLGPNGTGKTSTLNAIRFALSGKMPEGEIITRGESSCAVAVSIGKREFMREIGNKNRCMVKEAGHWKNVTKSSMEAALKDETGVDVSAFAPATSSSILRAMKPQELNTYLSKFIPQIFDRDQVKGWIPNLHPDDAAFIDKYLPDTPFGVDAITAFYKKMYEARRITKKEVASMAASLKETSTLIKPARDRAVIEKDLQDALELQKKEGLIQAQMAAYEKAVADAKKQKEEIKKLQQEMEAVQVKTRTEEEGARLDQLLREKQDLLNKTRMAMQSLNTTLATMEKTYASLNCDVCPISDKLTCKTDKSVIKQDLEAGIKSGKLSIETHKKAETDLMSNIKELQTQKQEYAKDMTLLQKKKTMQVRLETMRAQTVQIPEKPTAMTGTPAATRIQTDMQEIKVYDLLSAREKLEQVKSRKQRAVDAYDRLVVTFSEKGFVRAKATEMFVGEFTDICNRTAKELNPRMDVKFMPDNGLVPMLDVRGNGTYMTLDTLSGGEQMQFLFILMQMIGEVTGTRMLVMDELSVMDTENLSALLTLLTEHEDLYDQVFLSSAEHESVKSLFASHGYNA